MFYSFKMAYSMEHILIVVAVLALLMFVIWHFVFRNDRAVFEHSVVVNAPRERVFSVVNSLQDWSQWLPRVAALMPSAAKSPVFTAEPVFSFEGPASGKGAVMLMRNPLDGNICRWEIIEASEASTVVVREYVLPSTSPDDEVSVGGVYPTVHRITMEPGINSTRLHWVSTTDCSVLYTFLLRVIAGRYQAQFNARLNALKNHVESKSAAI